MRVIGTMNAKLNSGPQVKRGEWRSLHYPLDRAEKLGGITEGRRQAKGLDKVLVEYWPVYFQASGRAASVCDPLTGSRVMLRRLRKVIRY
jgi:hypothetical protein